MAFNFSPRTVQEGLVLYLDAANTRSYVSGSTAWRDLTINGNTGTLINGPTFSSANVGGIQFDGVDDYVLINSGSTSINPPTAFTVSSFFNVSSYTGNNAIICFKQNNYPIFFEQYAIGLYTTSIVFAVTGVDRSQKLASISGDYRNQNVYIVGTCDTITDELKMYFNGTLVQTLAFTSTFDIADTPINIGGMGVLKFGASFPAWTNGKIYSTSIYNRALSAQEVLQNYNALKSRFNLT